MQSPTPKANMVAAFLELKGWGQIGKPDKYLHFAPPEDLKFDNGFSFKIPVSEKSVDYKTYIQEIVFSIAELYDLNKWELLEELSKSSFDIQKEIEAKLRDIDFKQKLLAKAS